jgi:hypothetical protein
MIASVMAGQVGKFISATHIGIAEKPSFGPAGASGLPIQSTAMESIPCRSGIVSKS